MPPSASRNNTAVSVLRSIATITGQRDRDLLARTLLATLAELIHSHDISLYRVLPTDQGMEAVLMAQTCDEQPDSATHQQASIVIADHEDFQAVLNSGKSSVQAINELTIRYLYPITDKQHIVGVLKIISHPHSDADAHLISAFLLVYSNYLTILNESETDTLTGLLNRRTFENNLERIIAEYTAEDKIHADSQHPVRRNSSPELPHWLAVMDIDHFKRINDEFGHLYGDEVLLLLARNMKRVFRQCDKLFRFGGEEFIVVLDRTDLESAKNVLERFRDAIEKYDFPQVGRVTISIGFIKLDKADGTSSIVGRADQALYYAKEHGRNRVCFYDDLVADGQLAAENFSDDIELF